MKIAPAIAIVAAASSFVLTLASCHSAPTPAATPAPAAAAPPAARPPATTPPAAAPPGARAGGPPAGAPPPGGAPAAGRGRLSPDSAAKLRQIVVDSMMKVIAGHENEPAEQVFKNVQLFKGRTAGQLLTLMNVGYGRSLGLRCSSCHAAGDFASDTPMNKQRARIMQQMVNDINATHMPKMNATRPPVVNCMTCHHGLQSPNQAFDASLPAPYPPMPGAPARGGGGGLR